MTVLKGHVLQAGNVDRYDPTTTALLIVVSRDQLRDCPRNLAYANVEIRFADEVEKEKETCNEQQN